MEQEVLSAIAGALNIPADEFLQSVQNEAGEFLPAAEIATAVKGKITEQIKAVKISANKIALSNNKKAIIAKVKAIGYEIPDETVPADVIIAGFDEWKNEQAAQDTTKPDALTPEAIAKLPAFKTAVAEKLQAAQTENDRLKGEFEQYKKGNEQKTTREKAEAYVLKLAADKKFRIEAGNDKQQKALLRMVDLDKIRFDDKGNPYLIDDAGEPLVDDFGKAVSVEGHVLDANPFGVHEVDPNRGGAQPGFNGDGGGQGGTQKMTFAGQQQFDTYMQSEPDPAKRAIAATSWMENLEKQAK